MEEFWNQLEGMQAAKQQLLAQLGELYMELEKLETQSNGVKNSINGLRSQYGMLSTTFDSMKNALIQNLGITDGVYDIDFANRRVVPHGQVSNLGNGKPGPDNRSVWSGSNGGDPHCSHPEAE